jgi:hypothetical protein
MKPLLFISIILLISCKKQDVDISVSSRAQLESIKEPHSFRDSLGLGELAIPDKITQIKRYSYGADNYYYLEYYPGTKKLKTILYKPDSHPQSCAFRRCDFFYKDNKIEKVEIASPSSACEIIVKTYLFDYFPIGALKSVVQTDDFLINETFFSYDSSGRIGRIFQSGRYKNESVYRFSETSIKYDSTGNVMEQTFQPSYSLTITEKTTFNYGTSVNPFKGNFIPQEFLNVFGWNESSAFYLSPNVVSKTTRYYQSNGASQTYPYTIMTNNSRLHQFYFFDQFGSTFYYQ